MIDIVKYDINDGSLISYYFLKHRRKLIEIKSLDDIIKYKNKGVIFYSPNYILNERVFSIIKRGIVLIGLNDIKSKQMPKQISKMRSFVNMCKRLKIKIGIATLAKTKEDLRDEWQMIVISSIIGIDYAMAYKSIQRLEGFLKCCIKSI